MVFSLLAYALRLAAGRARHDALRAVPRPAARRPRQRGPDRDGAVGVAAAQRPPAADRLRQRGQPAGLRWPGRLGAGRHARARAVGHWRPGRRPRGGEAAAAGRRRPPAAVAPQRSSRNPAWREHPPLARRVGAARRRPRGAVRLRLLPGRTPQHQPARRPRRRAGPGRGRAGDRRPREPPGGPSPPRHRAAGRRGPARSRSATATAAARSSWTSPRPTTSSTSPRSPTPTSTERMRAFAQRVGAPLARPHVTREVAPRGTRGRLPRRRVDLAVASWLLGGFLLALVLALVRPAWSRGRTAGVLLAAGATLAVVVALVVSARGGPFLDFLLLGLAATVTTSAATTALVALLGLVGAAIASTVFVFLTAPLFTGHDPRLLPSPWRQVAPWTPHGATSDLATSFDLVRRPGRRTPDARAGRVPGRRAGGVGGCFAALRDRPSSICRASFLRDHALRAVAAGGAGRAGGGGRRPARPDRQDGRLRDAGAGGLADGVRATGEGDQRRRSSTSRSSACVPGRRSRVPTSAPTSGCRTGDGSGSSPTRCGHRTSTARSSCATRCSSSTRTASRRCCRRTTVPSSPTGTAVSATGRCRSPGCRSKGYDIVGVASQRVRTNDKPDGIFAFETLGPAMAVFVVPRGKTPQLLANVDIGPDKVDTTRTDVGSGRGRLRRLGLPLRHRSTGQARHLRLLAARRPHARRPTCCTATAGGTGTAGPGSRTPPRRRC